MFNLIGWIGAFLFAICAIPQAWKSYKEKHSDGISWVFLLLWFFGELFSIIYLFSKTDVAPLFFNYFCNFACLLVILRYKFKRFAEKL